MGVSECRRSAAELPGDFAAPSPALAAEPLPPQSAATCRVSTRNRTSVENVASFVGVAAGTAVAGEQRSTTGCAGGAVAIYTIAAAVVADLVACSGGASTQACAPGPLAQEGGAARHFVATGRTCLQARTSLENVDSLAGVAAGPAVAGEQRSTTECEDIATAILVAAIPSVAPLCLLRAVLPRGSVERLSLAQSGDFISAGGFGSSCSEVVCIVEVNPFC